jgi:hypothetical protein
MLLQHKVQRQALLVLAVKMQQAELRLPQQQVQPLALRELQEQTVLAVPLAHQQQVK